MKKVMISLAAAAAALTAIPSTAQAAPWQAINQRQAQLDQRIDAGVRSGRLTRSEANKLRSEYNGIARLEAKYRRDGLSVRERLDLDKRFNALSRKITAETRDHQVRRH